ncbi:MAG: sugar kinase [Geminicoccaceae bacterium]
MRRVALIGECMVELATRPDGALVQGFGGDTLNTALYLARLGVPVDYVTALGEDPFSDEMLAAWAAEGIGTGLVLRVPDRLPGLYLIRTDAQGERRFYYWRDRAPVRELFHLPGIDGIEAALAAAGLVYLSGITLSLFAPPDRERLLAVLARARAAGARIAFDTNFRPRGWPDRAAALAAYEQALRVSDCVLASVEDHGLLRGAAPPEAVWAWLDAAGVREAVVKLDRPAVRVWWPEGEALIEAEPVAEVVDTTAAGDSFAAGYLAARRAGRDPAAAAALGHRLAGAVVRHRGAIIPRAAMPALELAATAG